MKTSQKRRSRKRQQGAKITNKPTKGQEGRDVEKESTASRVMDSNTKRSNIDGIPKSRHMRGGGHGRSWI